MSESSEVLGSKRKNQDKNGPGSHFTPSPPKNLNSDTVAVNLSPQHHSSTLRRRASQEMIALAQNGRELLDKFMKDNMQKQGQKVYRKEIKVPSSKMSRKRAKAIAVPQPAVQKAKKRRGKGGQGRR